MAVIKSGSNGNVANVTSDNRLEIDGVTRTSFHQGTKDGLSYAWASVPYDYDAADTILAVKNTSSTHNLHIDYISMYTDTATQAQWHIITASYTSAGTEVVGVNLKSNAGLTASAEAYADETGNTQGSIINRHYIAAGSSSMVNTEGAIVLGQNHAIGVDYVTAGTAASVTIVGHYVPV